jgi:long-chain fatty acid transport protein
VNVSLGTWFPNGLSTAWDNPDTFKGRFLSQRVDLKQYALGLQVSAALTNWLSIGAGPELRISDVKLQKNFGTINPYSQSFVDVVHADIVGNGFATDITFGAGIQIKPTENFTLGASYHGHVDQTYKGNAVLYQVSTGHADLDGAVAAKYPLNKDVPVETTLQFPAIWAFGVAYHDCKLTIEAAATYTEWKVFDQTVFAFSPVDGKQVPTQTLVHNWVNSWSYRLGMNFQATEKFNLALGVLYDQTPQPDADVSPLLPDANRTGYSVGFGLKVFKSTVLEFSNLFLFFHERSTNGQQKDNYNGTYKTYANLTVLNLRTSF